MYNLISLDKAVRYSTKRVDSKNISLGSYISTDNILQDKLGVIQAIKLPSITGNTPAYDHNNILLANIRP
ncbi:MAG: restriction endonuclease subunit S, partial [Bacteroidota bacterium]